MSPRLTSKTSVVIAWTLSTAFVSPDLIAQVQIQNLAEPIAVFPEPFTTVSGLREMSDGRLLLADRTERHVSYIDFAAGTVDQVGRTGGGPSEYETPGRLLPLPNDATLLVDFGNMRAARITSEGRLDETWPMMTETFGFMQPTGTDAQGRFYFSAAGAVRLGGGSSTTPDSTPILRWDPANETTDTVAMLFVQPAEGSRSIRAGGAGGSFRLAGGQQAFRARDAWGVMKNGTVVVARSRGYRVDVYRDGQMAQGTDLPHDPVRITNDEKEAWADGQAGQRVTMVAFGRAGGGGGGNTMELPKPDIDEVNSPDFKPPFLASGGQITPDGEFWVQRYQRHNSTRTLYDVFNDQGELLKQVRLPEGRRLVGFGNAVLYATAKDEDDLQWLEQYGR